MKKSTAGVVAVATAVSLGLTACANIGLVEVPEAPEGFVRVLRMPSEAGGSVQGLVNYNIFGLNPVVQTWLFEPLMIRDRFTCEAVPWLATGYEWQGSDRLVLHIREGVKWNDGTPFTAKDVAFTFNLGKEYPAVDRAGLWGDFFGAAAQSVTATDDHTVVIQFSGDAVAMTDSVLGQRMLPEHIYSSVGDPTTFVDTQGVATGPYLPESFNGRRLVLVRNPDYWQADQVKVQRLVLEGSFDANAGALKMRNGALDLYRGDIPNPARSVVAGDPEHNRFFYPPDSTTVLAINNERPVLDDPKFREGMAWAIDREAISLRASFGIMEPASQTMLLLPHQEEAVPEKWVGKEFIGYDPAKSEELLDAAGYPRGADGWRVGPDGQPLNFIFSVQAGWMDIIAMADVVVRNLRAVGVQTRMIATDPNAVDGMQRSGSFDMVVDFVGGGCQRSRDLGARLDTAQISHGTDLLLNRARFSDPKIDALIAEWGKTLAGTPRDKEIEAQIIDVFMTQFPYIALQYAPSRLIYSTRNAEGWPSDEDPYPIDQLLRLAVKWKLPEGNR